MDELKHTPGPWRQEYLIILGPDGRAVGASTLDSGERQRPWEERVANARLIAAAPDLYAALQRMADLSDFCEYTDERLPPEQCPGIERDGDWCHWCQMRAALAKAESTDG